MGKWTNSLPRRLLWIIHVFWLFSGVRLLIALYNIVTEQRFSTSFSAERSNFYLFFFLTWPSSGVVVLRSDACPHLQKKPFSDRDWRRKTVISCLQFTGVVYPLNPCYRGDTHVDNQVSGEETHPDSYFSSGVLFSFCTIDHRCFYFLLQLCVLHDLVLLLIQVLLILFLWQGRGLLETGLPPVEGRNRECLVILWLFLDVA